jgi:hypothetical protein
MGAEVLVSEAHILISLVSVRPENRRPVRNGCCKSLTREDRYVRFSVLQFIITHFVISETHILRSLLFLISYARSPCLWSIADSLFPLFISHSVLFIGRESDITKEEIGKFSMVVLMHVVYATKGIHDMSLKVCFHYSSRSCSCSYFEFIFSYSFAALKYRLFVYFV